MSNLKIDQRIWNLSIVLHIEDVANPLSYNIKETYIDLQILQQKKIQYLSH